MLGSTVSCLRERIWVGLFLNVRQREWLMLTLWIILVARFGLFVYSISKASRSKIHMFMYVRSITRYS